MKPKKETDPLRKPSIIRKGDFPVSFRLSIEEAGITDAETAISAVQYADSLCHRCNLRVPGCFYCHEMYAAPFQQTFGWYLKSAIFSMGHDPRESYAWRKTHPKKPILTAAAQQVRRDFGFRQRGATLTCETILFYLARSAFSEEAVVHHHRPKFLKGLELDIFIPSVGVAIEYHGEQHFFPMDHWGGDEAFARTVERDRTKLKLCKENGIKILYWKEDSWQATEEYLREKVLKASQRKHA